MKERTAFIEDFTNNVEAARTSLKLSQKEFADQIGMSLSSYKRFLAHEHSKLDIYTLYKIIAVTGLTFTELCDDSTSKAAVLKKYKNLSDTQQAFIDTLISFENDFKPEPGSTAEDYIPMILPTGDATDGMIWDSATFEKINVADYRSRFGKDIHCAIRIDSQHLNPAYVKGDTLLICRRPPRDGDIGVFINKDDGRAYLRKYRQTDPEQLLPINGLGDTFKIDLSSPVDLEKWIFFGYVLTKMR